MSVQENVDPERIGVIGICGWGGMALNAAAIDTRIKATVASTMYDMTRVNAKGYFDSEDSEHARYEKRRALNTQRILDYKNGEYALAGGVVDILPEDAPVFIKDYYDYYKTDRGYHARSLNSNGGWNVTSALSFLNMPILQYSDEIRSAVLIMHGEKAHSCYFSRDAFQKLKGGNKELLIIPDAVHTDLYDRTDVIPFDKLEQFLPKTYRRGVRRMSKRRIAIVLSLVLLLSLCGCDMASSGNEPDIQQPKSSIGASSEGTVAETEEESSSEGKQSMDISFDFETKTVTLNSGYKMPINGIGTYSLLDEVCVESVSAALRSGVRLIDTAYMYHNEESVGEAVRNSGIPREEVFVTTKLYPSQFADPEAAIDEAMEKLDIGYIDLMLLHHPGEGDVEAYLAMEQAVADGKIRSIGLSNWYVEELEAFLPQVNIIPALVQNEIHPYYQENDVIPYIQDLGIVVQGWYPLGGRGHTAELLDNEVISEIAAAHGKSSAQVILRWNLQKGVVVIPGSSNPDHIQENTELYDFALTDDEMERINALDRNEKHDWY